MDGGARNAPAARRSGSRRRSGVTPTSHRANLISLSLSLARAPDRAPVPAATGASGQHGPGGAFAGRAGAAIARGCKSSAPGRRARRWRTAAKVKYFTTCRYGPLGMRALRVLAGVTIRNTSCVAAAQHSPQKRLRLGGACSGVLAWRIFEIRSGCAPMCSTRSRQPRSARA